MKITERFTGGLLVGVFLMIVFMSGAVSQKIWGLPILKNLSAPTTQTASETVNQRVVSEESVATDVAERVSPAVVTV